MIVDIPKVLREKLGDDGCTALVEVMNHVTENAKADVIELCTQRFERRLAEDGAKTRAAIEALRVDLSADMAKVRLETCGETVKLRIDISTDMLKMRQETTGETVKLRVDLAAVEVRILRWMVTLFIIQGVFGLVLKHLL